MPQTGISVEQLRQHLLDFVSAYPARVGAPSWWREPLLVTARADRRFEALTDMAAPDHLMPSDLLEGVSGVIVYFLPFTESLVRENGSGKFASRDWGLAYNQTNLMIAEINQTLAALLGKGGYASAVTPPTANFDHERLVSRWSHKHLAHIAGLGRFGVNSTIITPAGCAGRLGSLVTTAELGDHPLVTMDELCLEKRGESCGFCREKCPVGALQIDGLDRKRCWQRLNAVLSCEHMTGLPDYTHVCGKCQAELPCSFSVPQGA